MPRILVLTVGSARNGPYGIDKLQDLGYELFESSPARTKLHRKLRDVVEHRIGFPVDKTLRSLPQMAKIDAVLAFLESEAILASALKRRHIIPYARRPLAMFACWLADDLRKLPEEQRLAYAKRYQGVDLTLVWSENQLDILTSSGFREESVAAIPFGFAPELFAPVSQSRKTNDIVSVGLDRGRDFPTLVEAVRGTELTIDLYCHLSSNQIDTLPPNVRYHGKVPYEEYRKVISQTKIMVVPTKEMSYPSGQTVALEAGATGACLVLSDTPALREYFSEDTAFLVPPGDIGAWQDALLGMTNNPSLRARLGSAAAHMIQEKYTYIQMWRKVDELFRDRGIIS